MSLRDLAISCFFCCVFFLASNPTFVSARLPLPRWQNPSPRTRLSSAPRRGHRTALSPRTRAFAWLAEEVRRCRVDDEELAGGLDALGGCDKHAVAVGPAERGRRAREHANTVCQDHRGASRVQGEK